MNKIGLIKSITSPKKKHNVIKPPSLKHSDKKNAQKGSVPSGNKYLNIFWNQHQPSYKDEVNDCFTQPWVRLHATKDYYDMAAKLIYFPNVHATINLSGSLLAQLNEYENKLYDFADIKSPKRGDLKYYPKGHLDRQMDLLVTPIEDWSKEDKNFAMNNFFSADYKAQVEPWPCYKYLYDKSKQNIPFTNQDYRDLKICFHLAWMDHWFHAGVVELMGDDLAGKPIEPTETVSYVHKIAKQCVENGYKNCNFTEEDAISLALDNYKILKYVVPIHRRIQNRKSPDGFPQVDVITTPMFHPILPLIANTDSAKEANPLTNVPNPAFKAPSHADAHVKTGIEIYRKNFGKPPEGMWPGEGAVSEEVVPTFQKNGIKWISSGNDVCLRSGHAGDTGLVYRIDNDREYLGGNTDEATSIYFRSVHDKIGYNYGANKNMPDGIDAARDYLGGIMAWQHFNNVSPNEDSFISNMCDGENTWHNFINDGHIFLDGLYGILNDPNSPVKTATPSMFIKTHPVETQWELEPLGTGGWLNTFDTWIGDKNENDGWQRLRKTVKSLNEGGFPSYTTGEPDARFDRSAYFIKKAWMSIFAAEGSDYFWWADGDQGGTRESNAKFADDFRRNLINAYVFAQKAGFDIEYPSWAKPPIDTGSTTLNIPPITRDPKVNTTIIGPDKIKCEVSIKAYFDKKEGAEISEVAIDLRKYNISEQIPMAFDQNSNYKASFELPLSLVSNGVLAQIKAVGTNGEKSTDFVYIGMGI